MTPAQQLLYQEIQTLPDNLVAEVLDKVYIRHTLTHSEYDRGAWKK